MILFSWPNWGRVGEINFKFGLQTRPRCIPDETRVIIITYAEENENVKVMGLCWLLDQLARLDPVFAFRDSDLLFFDGPGTRQLTHTLTNFSFGSVKYRSLMQGLIENSQEIILLRPKSKNQTLISCVGANPLINRTNPLGSFRDNSFCGY